MNYTDSSIDCSLENENISTAIDSSEGIESGVSKTKISVSLSEDDSIEADINTNENISSEVDASVSVVTETSDHSKLENLDYDSSGHTGFQKEITSSNKLDYSLLCNTPEISVENKQDIPKVSSSEPSSPTVCTVWFDINNEDLVTASLPSSSLASVNANDGFGDPDEVIIEDTSSDANDGFGDPDEVIVEDTSSDANDGFGDPDEVII